MLKYFSLKKERERKQEMKNKKSGKLLIGLGVILVGITVFGVIYFFGFAGPAPATTPLMENGNPADEQQNRPTGKKDQRNPIIIEAVEYYESYGMGVNMNEMPSSPIYAYGIRRDQQSYKIVSLHHDGSAFDIVAVDEPLEIISSDNCDLTDNYKLVTVDNKLYFMRIAHYSSKTEGEDNSLVKEGKNRWHDLEVYYVDVTVPQPELELLLRTGDGPSVAYDTFEVQINEGYIYYLDKFDNQGEIGVLALGNNPRAVNGVLPDKIFAYHFVDNLLYVEYGKEWFDKKGYYHTDSSYGSVDLSKPKNGNGYNPTVKISAKKFINTRDFENLATTGTSMHHFGKTDTYRRLMAADQVITLTGHIIKQKEGGFAGETLLANGNAIYEYQATADQGIILLNTQGSIINFCIGSYGRCGTDQYYSYDLSSKAVEKV